MTGTIQIQNPTSSAIFGYKVNIYKKIDKMHQSVTLYSNPT